MDAVGLVCRVLAAPNARGPANGRPEQPANGLGDMAPLHRQRLSSDVDGAEWVYNDKAAMNQDMVTYIAVDETGPE